MIYESRPNVTIEAASLAIKSGNACILRGGSEALQSNLALAALVQRVARRGRPAARRGAARRHDRPRRGRPPDRRARVGRPRHPARRQGPDRAHRPRGQGAGAQAPRRQLPRLRRCRRRPRRWRCAIVDNAKTQKLSPCNAAESLLVHAAVAAAFLPRIGAVFATKGVEMRGDAAALALLAERAPARSLVAATEADWSEEYLARDHQHQGRRLARRGDRATSTATARTTPTRSSPTRTPRRCASCARSIRPA